MATTSKSRARVIVSATGAVHVHVNAKTLYNLEELQRLVPMVLGPLGCPGCHSGRQIIWQQEEGEFEAG